MEEVSVVTEFFGYFIGRAGCCTGEEIGCPIGDPAKFIQTVL